MEMRRRMRMTAEGEKEIEEIIGGDENGH